MKLEDLDPLMELASSRDRRPGWLSELAWISDPGCKYYLLFDELVSAYAPLNILEIGMYIGAGTGHLAEKNTGGTVVTIDIDPETLDRASRIPLSNIKPIKGDSVASVNHPTVLQYSPYDILFIDGLHTLDQAWAEYLAYKPLVKKGGLIFFDDLTFSPVADQMQMLWERIPEPKRRIDAWHHTGFGVCQV